MELPKCGLYVTGIALADKEEAVAQGQLVYFHNHSRQGPPIVLLPHENTHNRWSFAEHGFLVEGEAALAFIGRLEPRAAQGFYVAEKEIAVPGGRIPARMLVQVGYNRQGEPILFPARTHENGMQFSEKGFRFDGLSVFERLRPGGFTIEQARDASDRTLH
jgi:hypothetical protein